MTQFGDRDHACIILSSHLRLSVCSLNAFNLGAWFSQFVLNANLLQSIKLNYLILPRHFTKWLSYNSHQSHHQTASDVNVTSLIVTEATDYRFFGHYNYLVVIQADIWLHVLSAKHFVLYDGGWAAGASVPVPRPAFAVGGRKSGR